MLVTVDNERFEGPKLEHGTRVMFSCIYGYEFTESTDRSTSVTCSKGELNQPTCRPSKTFSFSFSIMQIKEYVRLCVCFCVCVCVCECTLVRTCVGVWLGARVLVCAGVYVHVCVCLCLSGCLSVCLAKQQQMITY